MSANVARALRVPLSEVLCFPWTMNRKLFLITILTLAASAQQKWDCTSYLGSRGRCVTLDKCDVLRSLLTGPRPNKSVNEILRNYQCGFIDRDPKVCCPGECEMLSEIVNGKDCITPDGETGTCTSLDDCDDLRNSINNNEFIFQDNMDFFRRSKCTPQGTSTSISVCCKSDSDDRTSSGTTSPTVNRVSGQCDLDAFPTDPKSKCCGIDGSGEVRIIGGNATGIDQYPWLGLVEYSREGFACGASLISGRYALSAAHCLVGSQRKSRGATAVRFGEYDKSNPGIDCIEVAGNGTDCTEGPISVPIESFVAHEDYDPNQVLKYHDIALIKLADSVKYTDFIRPICLPTSDFTKSLTDDMNLLIAGWGVFDKTRAPSDIKLHAKVPYVTKEDCQVRYKYGRIALAESQICVGGESNRDSCTGDSGGPLMLLRELTHEAVGVISFGPSECGLETWPSIYTKVYDYLDWIKSNIKP